MDLHELVREDRLYELHSCGFPYD